MKHMIIMISILSFLTNDLHSQKMRELTRSEKKFVKNVTNMRKEPPVGITKREDSHIVVEFKDMMVILQPDGFVGDIWIKGDNNWLSLGVEKDGY